MPMGIFCGVKYKGDDRYMEAYSRQPSQLLLLIYTFLFLISCEY